MALYTVFKQRLANKLQSMGFRVVKMAPNRNNPKFVVYYFEDSVALRDALHELLG